MTSSGCLWFSPVRSGRTVRRGGEGRSWFGRPQAIKKAAGNAATKGTNASNVLASKHHHPLQTISGAVDAVYELPKKGAVPTRPPVRRLSPHRREQIKGDGKNTYWLSPLRPNDSRRQQTKRREGSLPLPFDASPPFTKRGASIRSLRYKPFRYQQKHSSMKNPWVP